MGDEEDADDVASDIVEGSSDDDSDFGSFDGQHGFPDEETKSRFTSYSMTSSVIRRSEGLTLIDDRFEKVCTLFKLFFGVGGGSVFQPGVLLVRTIFLVF